MTSFSEKLNRRAKAIDSLLCVGLDPHPTDLPEQTGEAARDFCLRLIESTQAVALAFKPNAAFFEVLGSAGWDALKEVIAAIPDEIPVILDAKRGDIASTAQAYARSAFEALGADAITLSPYLGHDSLAPFLSDPEKGVFLLCKTSNPGSGDLQDLSLGSEDESMMVYEKVASLAAAWNEAGNIGLVVGATYPEALERVRRRAPDQWLLTPGLGAQGGDLTAALKGGLREDGLGLLINVSRGISRAEDPGRAAAELVQQVRAARQVVQGQRLIGSSSASLPNGLLAEGLLAMGCVRFGTFTLKSGLISPIYIDLRRLVSFPEWMQQVAAAYIRLLRNLQFDRIVGLPYAGLPIATAISLQGGWPMIYPRKTVKDYGTSAEIEGLYSPGEKVVVIDDLATTGGSKFEAIDKLTEAGLQVSDVVVLIDRESGAKEALAARGYKMHALFTLTALLDHWETDQRLPQSEIDQTRIFLNKSSD